jgi:hypothetical protein
MGFEGIKHFKKGERGTYCPCGCGLETPIELLMKLDEIRELYGYPIKLEQTVTCEKYSLKLGRRYTSEHITEGDKVCRAVDFNSGTYAPFKDYREGRRIIADIAYRLGFKGFGIGTGKDKRLHIDMREDYAEWFY